MMTGEKLKKKIAEGFRKKLVASNQLSRQKTRRIGSARERQPDLMAKTKSKLELALNTQNDLISINEDED